MKQIVLIIGSLYGLLSVILGAFVAHTFKKLLPPDKSPSLDTGGRYQMYHSILLSVIGFVLSFTTLIER